jgi:hypothetical protein
VDAPIPLDLVTKVVQARLAEIDARDDGGEETPTR